MMKLIGARRMILLIALIAINAAIICAYLFMVEPMRQDAELQRDAARSEAESLQMKIQSVQQEVASTRENLPKYEALKTKGFFLDQDRFRLSRDLGDVRAAAGLKGFSYNIVTIQKIPNAEAEAGQMSLINSKVTVNNISMLVDTELYGFFDVLEAKFPAHVRINSFKIARAVVLTEDVLRSLSQPNAPPVVSAEVVFSWNTLVPIAADPANTTGVR